MSVAETQEVALRRRRGSRFGPGLAIAASFIGPGATSIVTGAGFDDRPGRRRPRSRTEPG